MYKINELTQKAIDDLDARMPKAEHKKYQLVESDDRGQLVLSYHAFKADAEEELKRWLGRDEITIFIEDCLHNVLEVAKDYGIEESEARRMLRES